MTKKNEPALIVHSKSSAQRHATIHGSSEEWFFKWKNARRSANMPPVLIEGNNCDGCVSFKDETMYSERCTNCREYTHWKGVYSELNL